MKLKKFGVYIGSALMAMASVAVVSGQSAAIEKVERDLPLTGFNKIHSTGSLKVLVTVGPAESVKLIVEDDLLEKLDIYVDDGTLVVGMKRGTSFFTSWFGKNSERDKVIVTLPEFKGFSLKGSGDGNITGGKGDAVDLALAGSGDIEISDADYRTWNLSLKGSGDIKAAGQCETSTMKLRGSGDIKVRSLECKEGSAELKGSGDINFFASEQAIAVLRGSGDIRVYGNPEIVDRKEKGSGDIHIK